MPFLKDLKVAKTFSLACSERCGKAILMDDPHSLEQTITNEATSQGWGGNFWIDSEMTFGSGDVEPLLVEVGQRGAVKCLQMVTAHIFSDASWVVLSPEIQTILVNQFSKSIGRLYAFHLAQMQQRKLVPGTPPHVAATKSLDGHISAIAAVFFAKDTATGKDIQAPLDQLRAMVPAKLDPALLQGAEIAIMKSGAVALAAVALKPLPSGSKRPRL